MSIITVKGKINKEDIGITLPHEHIFISQMFEFRSSDEMVKQRLSEQKLNINNLHFVRRDPYVIKDNLILNDENLMLSELLEFKKAGGNTIVEQSSIGCGRSPEALRNISNISGVSIVMGCGYYLKETLNEKVFLESESELIKKLIKEIRFGINETNIKPGIIGEVGIGPVIGEWEKKSLKISVKVHQETGLAISIHIQAIPTIPNFEGKLNGIEVLNILEKAGANLNKIAILHTDAKVDLKYAKDIADLGAYVSFDHISRDLYFESSDFLMDRDMDRVYAIKEFIESGYNENILISQDICLKTDLTAYGGFGYGYILNDFVPLMMKKGVSREAINNIMIKNPGELLDVEGKYL